MPGREPEENVDRIIGHISDCITASMAENTWIFMRKDVAKDIIELLKNQIPAEPEIGESYLCSNGRMSRRHVWCGVCGIGINFDAKFCDHCGRPVKWNVV